MATLTDIDPLPLIQGLIEVGQEDGWSEYINPAVCNQLLGAYNTAPDKEDVNEISRKQHDPSMKYIRVVPFTRSLDHYRELVYEKFKFPTMQTIYDIKNKILSQLGNTVSALNQSKIGVRNEVIEGILTKLSKELGDPSNRPQPHSVAMGKYNTVVLEAWNKSRNNTAMSNVLRIFQQNPGFDKALKYNPAIVKDQFRQDGFIRAAQRFLGDQNALLLEFTENLASSDNNILWDNWTYVLTFATQTIDTGLIQEVRRMSENQEFDILDRIAFCVLCSGSATDVILEMHTSLNSNAEDWTFSNRDFWRDALLDKILNAQSSDRGKGFSKSAYQAIRKLIAEGSSPAPAPPKKLKRKRGVTVVTEEGGAPEYVGTAIPFEQKEPKGGGNGLVVALGALIALVFLQGGL